MLSGKIMLIYRLSRLVDLTCDCGCELKQKVVISQNVPKPQLSLKTSSASILERGEQTR
jgi:hypothetical protein